MLKSIVAIIVYVRSCLQWYCTFSEVERLGNIMSYFLVCCISSIMCTLEDRSMWILGLVPTASNVVLMMASSKNFG